MPHGARFTQILPFTVSVNVPVVRLSVQRMSGSPLRLRASILIVTLLRGPSRTRRPSPVPIRARHHCAQRVEAAGQESAPTVSLCE